MEARAPSSNDFQLLYGSKRAGVEKIFGMKNPAKAHLCYINALCQCLLSLGVLPLETLAPMGLDKQPSWKALAQIFELVQSSGMGDSVPCGSYLTTLLGGKLGEQQDAHELLLVLCDRLDSEIPKKKKKKKKKKASDGWAEVSKTGAAMSVTTLGVVEPSPGPVMQCFGAIFEKVKKTKKILEPSIGCSIEYDRDWQEQVARLNFHKIPKVLIIHLQRSMDSKGFLKSGKKSNFAEFFAVNSVKYRLCALVLHAGETTNRGHYIARIRCENSEENEEKTTEFWSERNDEKCAGKHDSAFDEIDPFCPYILFLEQIE